MAQLFGSDFLQRWEKHYLFHSAEPLELEAATVIGKRREFIASLAACEKETALDLYLSKDEATGAAVAYLKEIFKGKTVPPFLDGISVVPRRLTQKFQAIGYGDWEQEWQRELLMALGWYDRQKPLNWKVCAHVGALSTGRYSIPRFVLNLVAQMSAVHGRQQTALRKRKESEIAIGYPLRLQDTPTVFPDSMSAETKEFIQLSLQRLRLRKGL